MAFIAFMTFIANAMLHGYGKMAQQPSQGSLPHAASVFCIPTALRNSLFNSAVQLAKFAAPVLGDVHAIEYSQLQVKIVHRLSTAKSLYAAV